MSVVVKAPAGLVTRGRDLKGRGVCRRRTMLGLAFSKSATGQGSLTGRRACGRTCPRTCGRQSWRSPEWFAPWSELGECLAGLRFSPWAVGALTLGQVDRARMLVAPAAVRASPPHRNRRPFPGSTTSHPSACGGPGALVGLDADASGAALPEAARRLTGTHQSHPSPSEARTRPGRPRRGLRRPWRPACARRPARTTAEGPPRPPRPHERRTLLSTKDELHALASPSSLKWRPRRG